MLFRDDMWSLYSANMKDISSASSFGWNPKEKKAEMFHKTARHLVVYPIADTSALCGFLTFRFETEPNYKELEKDDDVLYIYEIHVSEVHRRKGIGAFVLSVAEQLGRKWKMDRLMLTVLLVNTAALHHYAKYGFVIDASSPNERHDLFLSPYATAPASDEDPWEDQDATSSVCDYLILCRPLLERATAERR